MIHHVYRVTCLALIFSFGPEIEPVNTTSAGSPTDRIMVTPGLARSSFAMERANGELSPINDNVRGLRVGQRHQGPAFTEDIIDVTQFGAKGDGLTDDTTAIQNAINAAYRTINGSGRVAMVYVPRGEYKICTLSFTNSLSTGSMIFYGAGMGHTYFKLKPSCNAIGMSIGGSVNGANATFLRLTDFTLDGNKAHQSGSSVLMKWQRGDRSQMERVHLMNGKSHNLHVLTSTLVCYECESFDSDGHGVLVDGATDFRWVGGFVNTNANYGFYFQYTDTYYSSSQRNLLATVQNAHLEQNGSAGTEGGSIYVSSYDNVQIIGNLIQPLGTNTNPIVEFAGTALGGRIFNNVFMSGGWDHANRTDGTVGASDFFLIKFGASTAENLYMNNMTEITTGNRSPNIVIDQRGQIQDLGRNYNVDVDRLQIRTLGSKEGSADAFGWLSRVSAAALNLLTYSEDLSNPAWTKTGSYTAVTSTTAIGNPYSLTGNATALDYPNDNGTPTIRTLYQIPTVTIAVGEMYSFSVWAYANGYTPGASRDIRLLITDNIGSKAYAEQNFRIQNAWQRIYVSFTNTTGGDVVNPRVVIFNTKKTGAYRNYFWGAQFNKGDVAPYFPSLGSTTSNAAKPGVAGLSVSAIKSLNVGQGQDVTRILTGVATLDFDLSNTGITCQDLTIKVVGASNGDPVFLGIPDTLASTTGVIFSGWTSKADTVTVRACDVDSSNPNPSAITVSATVVQH
jgi:hypothetical protein